MGPLNNFRSPVVSGRPCFFFFGELHALHGGWNGCEGEVLRHRLENSAKATTRRRQVIEKHQLKLLRLYDYIIYFKPGSRGVPNWIIHFPGLNDPILRWARFSDATLWKRQQICPQQEPVWSVSRSPPNHGSFCALGQSFVAEGLKCPAVSRCFWTCSWTSKNGWSMLKLMSIQYFWDLVHPSNSNRISPWPLVLSSFGWTVLSSLRCWKWSSHMMGCRPNSWGNRNKSSKKMTAEKSMRSRNT